MNAVSFHQRQSKGRTIIYLEGGGMKNPEKNCLQKQKSPNKLFAKKKMKKKKVCRLVDGKLFNISHEYVV